MTRTNLIGLITKIFATHGVGGIVGNLLTGLFAQASVAGFDGFTEIPGGWLDRHYIQLAYQIADSVAGFAYSFGVTVSLPLNTLLSINQLTIVDLFFVASFLIFW